MLDSVPGRTRLCSGTITVLRRSGWRSLQWEPRVWTSTKPARSSARLSRAPETRGGPGSRRDADVDRADDGRRGRRLVLEVELKGLGEVGERLIDRRPLADHGNLDTAGHEPVVVRG